VLDLFGSRRTEEAAMPMNHSQSNLTWYDLSFVLLKPVGLWCRIIQAKKKAVDKLQGKFPNPEKGKQGEKS
jgi:hypothetical protein